MRLHDHHRRLVLRCGVAACEALGRGRFALHRARISELRRRMKRYEVDACLFGLQMWSRDQGCALARVLLAALLLARPRRLVTDNGAPLPRLFYY